ncbi:hypothetical protein V5031_09880 [Enterobacter kobei]|uniref:hypothetical protein n=1 Tax=Enterobacter kobei TaxID=208224 RepID=UPI002003A74A|nr:hypothetical protein [Enterobacter kobei]MCK7125887.1 hypothetical protein [Enterobacter kobei]MCM7875024.1 hypothetical protein [Enterobacter kobei]MCW4703846.1 hypothetical protein [Enterobacter kobei]UZQ65879.1 hypothetical protein OQE50_12920 [Enterobacter kobei]
MSKAGAVLIALLTTGMAEGGAQKQDLWKFISGMSASLRSLSVTSLSNAPLSFKITRQNEYINFYNADDFKLDDGASITEIGLRLSKDNGDMAPLLNFSPSGQCITLDTVKIHFPQLVLTDYPQGRSENEVTSYTAPKDSNGQKVSFSFTVKKPDCLDSVVISAE